MKYSAFISYCRSDEAWSRWLHNALESYRFPKHLIGRPGPDGPLPRRLKPVFRDRDELASAVDLGKSIEQALVASANLIVICSPAAARSKWVNIEIERFAATGRLDRYFCLIVAGDPSDRDPANNCFPPALAAVGLNEPLAADARDGGDGKRAALVKLLAGLSGIGYDELRQREAARRHRRLIAIASAASAGLIVTSTLAIVATISRQEAIEQRDLAVRKTITAERTVGFVKSLFEVSDPSEARGQAVTAREILDRGARAIRTSLNGEPAVKAELGTTLGEVYAGLGLYKASDQLLREMMALRHDDASTRTRQVLALAESEVRQGKYKLAIDHFRRALEMARTPGSRREDLEPKYLVGLGEALSAEEDYPAAARAIAEGLQADLQRLGPNHPDIARDLEAEGLNAFFSGKLAVAEAAYVRAMAIRVRLQGGDHPRVTEDLNSLAAIAYLRGDAGLAEARYRLVMQNDGRVLGPNHPQAAATLNNLARVILERRGYSEAQPLLQRAVAINLAELGPDHDDIIFPLANLAMVEDRLGDASAAEALFRRALTPARRHHHRNLGPILTDLADLRCRAGDFTGAASLLDEAKLLMLKDYPDDGWRAAWVENTRGGCMLRAGDRAAAQRLIAASEPQIQAKWTAASHFGAIARRRSAMLQQARS